MSTIQTSSTAEIQQAAVAKAHLSAVNADPKWAKRHRVIEALESYKARLASYSPLRDRYDTLCTRLYSGRSSRITGMPVNHDQFAAGDRFAEMLDEKMELERALADADAGRDELELALGFLDGQSRLFLRMFYLEDNPRKAKDNLMRSLNLSSTGVYNIRNEALDKFYNIIYPEEITSENGESNGKG